MRILQLTPGCFDKGGISRYSRYQISAVREICGAENLRVYSLLGPGEESLEERFDVDWHGAGKFGSISTADRLRFAARVLGVAMRWRPDAIVSAHVNFGPLVTRAAQISGARTILNVYGLEIWSSLSEARKRHMRRFDQVISDCHFTARYVAEAGLHADPPTVIWDPVDIDKFVPGPIDRTVVEKYSLPDPASHLVVMSLGRLSKAAAHKGFDRLISVAADLASNIPQLRLVVAGRGDDRPRLEALALQHGIAENVVFTGSVDEPDLPALYRCAHVFSLVSDRGHGRGEGIPLTPLEAMACGVPIIVGNEDGSQEAVVYGRNGFVVSPRDPAQHRDVLARLLGDAELRTRLGDGARAVAEQNFSYVGFVEKHRLLLNSIAEGAPRHRPA
jgi:phosphatidylinositol alpha-1,6-mannosyltransferase